MNDWRMQLASDSELSSLFAQFAAGELLESELDLTERQKFVLVYGSLWSIYESAYFARNYGTLGESEWTRFELMMCHQYGLSTKQGMWSGMDRILSPEFRDFAAEECI